MNGKFDFLTVIVAIVTGEVNCAIKIIWIGSLDWYYSCQIYFITIKLIFGTTRLF